MRLALLAAAAVFTIAAPASAQRPPNVYNTSPPPPSNYYPTSPAGQNVYYTGTGYGVNRYAAPMPPPPPRRSTGMMIAGIVLTSVGGVALIGAAISASIISTSSSLCFDNGSSCPGPDYTGIIPFVVLGVVGLGVGIPLTVIGARRVQEGPPAVSLKKPETWIGSPGGAGWMWRF